MIIQCANGDIVVHDPYTLNPGIDALSRDLRELNRADGELLVACSLAAQRVRLCPNERDGILAELQVSISRVTAFVGQSSTVVVNAARLEIANDYAKAAKGGASTYYRAYIGEPL